MFAGPLRIEIDFCMFFVFETLKMFIPILTLFVPFSNGRWLYSERIKFTVTLKRTKHHWQDFHSKLLTQSVSAIYWKSNARVIHSISFDSLTEREHFDRKHVPTWVRWFTIRTSHTNSLNKFVCTYSHDDSQSNGMHTQNIIVALIKSE